MSVEPTYNEGDVFLATEEMTVHKFFQENSDNVSAWGVQNFLRHYPSDFSMYLSSLRKIKSYKEISVSIRKYCIRQLDFLDSAQGRTYARVIQAKNRTRTNTDLIQENELDLSQRDTISQQDIQLSLGENELDKDKGKAPYPASTSKNKIGYNGSSMSKGRWTSSSTRDIPVKGKGVSKPVSSSSSVRTTPQDDVVDTDDTSIGEITAVAMYSPFSHLVMRLYKIYGHAPVQFNPPVRFSTDIMSELYRFAEKILDNWHSSCKIDQKNCLVALSGILNTMDPDLEPHFTGFSDIASRFIENDLFTISETQETIFNGIKKKLGGGTIDNLHALRRYCSRRRDDLEETMPTMNEDQRQTQEEEHKIMQIMEFICEEIIFMQRISKSSEHEDVFWWRGIARILYEHDLVVRVGELGSSSTRNDRTEIESSFGGTESNVRARKIDILHQLCMQGVNRPLELLSWEAKPVSASDETLQTQLRKNIRTNASIMKSLMQYMDCGFPRPSPLVLDIVGPRALVYTVRKIESGVFVAGLVGKGMIEIPMHADDIGQFLDSGSLSALIRVGRHNSSFANLIKRGYRKAQNEAAMAKITRRSNVRKDGPPIIFTPTKKKQKQQNSEFVDLREPEDDFVGAYDFDDYK